MFITLSFPADTVAWGDSLPMAVYYHNPTDSICYFYPEAWIYIVNKFWDKMYTLKSWRRMNDIGKVPILPKDSLKVTYDIQVNDSCFLVGKNELSLSYRFYHKSKKERFSINSYSDSYFLYVTKKLSDSSQSPDKMIKWADKQMLIHSLYEYARMKALSQDVLNKFVIRNDSIIDMVFKDKQQIAEFGEAFHRPPILSNEFHLKTHDVYIVCINLCFGVYCPSIYVFQRKGEDWYLTTSTFLQMSEAFTMKEENDSIVFETKSGKVIGTFP
jgi:hypothetical protein